MPRTGVLTENAFYVAVSAEDACARMVAKLYVRFHCRSSEIAFVNSLIIRAHGTYLKTAVGRDTG